MLFTWIRNTIGGCVSGAEWDATKISDLSGKVACVTGVSIGGIGYECAKALVRRGCHVYLACRDESRAAAAMASIERELALELESPSASIGLMTFLAFDLLDLEGCTNAAEVIVRKETRLDFVSVAFWPLRLINGIEVQFFNHLGHDAFVRPLLPLLSSSPSPRVIIVTSNTHAQSPRPDLTSLATAGLLKSSTFQRYAHSKLCNLLLVNALSRKLPPTVKVLGAHPGPVATALYRGTDASFPFTRLFAKYIIPLFLLTPEEGARSVLFGACAPEQLVGPSGGYVIPFNHVATPSLLARDEALADELWEFSAEAARAAIQTQLAET